jgi:hypothetical protein
MDAAMLFSFFFNAILFAAISIPVLNIVRG